MDTMETQQWNGVPYKSVSRASSVIDLDTPEKSRVKQECLEDLPPAPAAPVQPVEPPVTSPEPTPKPKPSDLLYTEDLTPEKKVWFLNSFLI